MDGEIIQGLLRKIDEMQAAIDDMAQTIASQAETIKQLNATIAALSVNRVHQIFGSGFGIPLATGTVSNVVTRLASVCNPVVDRIKKNHNHRKSCAF